MTGSDDDRRSARHGSRRGARRRVRTRAVVAAALGLLVVGSVTAAAPELHRTGTAAATAQAEETPVAEEQTTGGAGTADATSTATADAAGPTTGATSEATDAGIAGWVDGRPVDADGTVLWVTSVPTADGDGTNGNLPASQMCLIEWGTDQLGFAQYLRCDAADALTALNEAFQARFGSSIDLDLTYRSYADQVAMKAAFGALAATPGTSAHGWGTALDVQEWDSYAFDSERYVWLVENGPTYGWYAPAEVREGQPYEEYWHFEYEPGRTS
ncbi:MAG TPA: M15 family metallopeptidase [Cellulomonas sp.]